MRNILVSLLAGAAVFCLLFFTGVLNLGESVVPGVLLAVIAYFLLARRTFKQVETIFNGASVHLQKQPPKFDLAIVGMQKAYAFASVQIGVKTQVDSQIGVLHFLQKDFTKAMPYLERAKGFGHWMGTAMLAVIHYKKRNHSEMKDVLQIVVKRGKAQSLAWNLSAYLLLQIGERDAAQMLLVEGLKKSKQDPKVQEALLAVQNGKKIKMRGYKEQWYQFHLERPPAQYQQANVGGKVSKMARRGRW